MQQPFSVYKTIMFFLLKLALKEDPSIRQVSTYPINVFLRFEVESGPLLYYPHHPKIATTPEGDGSLFENSD